MKWIKQEKSTPAIVCELTAPELRLICSFLKKDVQTTWWLSHMTVAVCNGDVITCVHGKTRQ